MYRPTQQEMIDDATMRIENPNIVGSGYIQFPPQKPFEQPLKMQPPTLAEYEDVMLGGGYNSGYQPPQSAVPRAAAPPQHQQHRPQQPPMQQQQRPTQQAHRQQPHQYQQPQYRHPQAAPQQQAYPPQPQNRPVSQVCQCPLFLSVAMVLHV
eukprot:CAMPEP_0117655226 /NCGR_PEP_ID=MMETSP0804-20121206/4168_1 /TAXON_ID=1074897 /ORGANISM="Tetraselmis astigmatica, Strain CCMP880" /LENGTH=151 /DNA_ID=CAMNT_0005461567 /DNA_START=88 /DNA_END=543 /DNA_ORIENTATION=+